MKALHKISSDHLHFKKTVTGFNSGHKQFFESLQVMILNTSELNYQK